MLSAAVAAAEYSRSPMMLALVDGRRQCSRGNDQTAGTAGLRRYGRLVVPTTKFCIGLSV